MFPEKEWLASLSVGDTVGVNSGRWHWSYKGYTLHTITKITPTRQITLDNGQRFTNDGYEMGAINSFYRAKLCTYETAVDAIEKCKLSKKLEASKKDFDELWDKAKKHLTLKDVEALTVTLKEIVSKSPGMQHLLEPPEESI